MNAQLAPTPVMRAKPMQADDAADMEESRQREAYWREQMADAEPSTDD